MGSVDMSPEAVMRRLMAVSRLRDIERERRPAVDMSPRAVTLRLETVAKLHGLCLALEALGRNTRM